MKINKLILFIHKKLKGELSEQEQSQLAGELRDGDNRRLAEEVEKAWKLSGKYQSGYQPDTELGLVRFRERMNSDKKRIQQLDRRRWWRMAAAVILLVSAGLFWLWPGQLPAVQMTTITTGAAESREVLLADGSTVILNENSRLTYPTTFDGQPDREIVLLGEAYFSVQPDAAHPFCIRTTETEVCVLGTAFNLRAYPSETFSEVEVEEGKVMFRKLNGEDQLLLQKNERGVIRYDNGQALQEEVSGLNAQFWRTGRLLFRKASMPEVENTLERYFNIELRFEPALPDCSLNLDFQDEDLEDILALIAGTFNAKVQQEGDRAYLIEGGKCK